MKKWHLFGTCLKKKPLLFFSRDFSDRVRGAPIETNRPNQLATPPSKNHGGRCRPTNLTSASNLSESLLVSPPSNSHGGRCRSTNLTPASNLSESLLVSPPDKRRQKCAAEVRNIYAPAGCFVDLMGQPSGRFSANSPNVEDFVFPVCCNVWLHHKH